MLTVSALPSGDGKSKSSKGLQGFFSFIANAKKKEEHLSGIQTF